MYWCLFINNNSLHSYSVFKLVGRDWWSLHIFCKMTSSQKSVPFLQKQEIFQPLPKKYRHVSYCSFKCLFYHFNSTVSKFYHFYFWKVSQIGQFLNLKNSYMNTFALQGPMGFYPNGNRRLDHFYLQFSSWTIDRFKTKHAHKLGFQSTHQLAEG